MPTPSADPTAAALDIAHRYAREWIAGLDTRAVAATRDAATLRTRMERELTATGVSAEQVVQELIRDTEGGFLGNAGGRFFAWVIGGALPSALAADWLVSTWDQNSAVHATGPAAALVEEIAGEWLLDLLELPRTSSFAFTTGCQMAHVTCLAAARHAVLRKLGIDSQRDGLHGAPPIRVLVSTHRHSTVDFAVRMLGIGTQQIEVLAVDALGRVTSDALTQALAASSQPTIVVLDAADLNIAAFDDVATLIPIAKTAGAWVHIDGAFGLFARASRTKAHLMQGAELADSWATDAHKWLNVPYDCGVAIVRDREAHHAAMAMTTSYIPANDTLRDQMDWNPELSRRARGFPVYAALRELGRDGLAALIDRCCAHCHAIVTGIAALPGAELLWEPQLNQGLVRFPDPSPAATDAEHDRRTDAVIAAINATGEAFFSGTTWHGRRAMRVSVVNWRTTDADVQRAVAAAAQVLAG